MTTLNFFWNPGVVKTVLTTLKKVMTNTKTSGIIKTSSPPRGGDLPYPGRQNLLECSVSQIGFKYQMNSNILNINRAILAIFGVFAGALSVAAQTALDRERSWIDASANRWYYTIAFVVIAAAIGGVILWVRIKKGTVLPDNGFESRHQDRPSYDDFDEVGVDAEKELEWFRKAKKSSAKPEISAEASPLASPGRDRRSRKRLSEFASAADGLDELHHNAKYFQEKMKRAQFANLPIHSFLQLNEARPFEQLAISADPALLCAIEQANEEFEEDEAVRELAVRILAAFRYRNSVEALSQIALYDLSSNLRSKAVAILTEFDHESVFESILLACADPTREVRAAAARGLFRLSFDRADAWKRLIATKDEYRMAQAARAAVEAGIVQKSFDRLLHEDMRIAYEAVALVGMLLRSGETDEVFDAIRDHQDERVKLALIHVIKIVKDERALERLQQMRREVGLPEEVAERVDEALNAAEAVAA